MTTVEFKSILDQCCDMLTESDTWRSIANSVLETQRVDGVKYIYVVFGKMGGVPEVRWGEYEASVVHVRTSHVPRFEVEIANPQADHRESLFKQMGIRQNYSLFDTIIRKVKDLETP